MCPRTDPTQVRMPVPESTNPDALPLLRELVEAPFGEASLLGAYMRQAAALRGRKGLRPYHTLVAAIATEKLGHLQPLLAALRPLRGDTARDDPQAARRGRFDMVATHARRADQEVAPAAATAFTDAAARSAMAEQSGHCGNPMLDLLHAFFLENAGQRHRLRICGMTGDPAVRETIGYLLVRGGVHAHALALALEKLSGVEMRRMLSLLRIEEDPPPESRPFEEAGEHRRLYCFQPGRERELAWIWHGVALDGSGPLEVVIRPAPQPLPDALMPENEACGLDKPAATRRHEAVGRASPRAVPTAPIV